MTISRRDVIKKGAVAGAVLWTVPVIESVTARAAAASGVFPCSWAIIVYYKPGSGGPDTNTYFVNGWAGNGSGGACSQGNNNKLNGTQATFLSNITITYNTQDVLIADTSTNLSLDIPLPGGSGMLGGTASTNCPSGANALTLSGRTFSVGGNLEILGGIAFGGNKTDVLTPGAASQSITFPNCQ